MGLMTHVTLLRDIPLFEALSTEDLGVLASRLVTRACRSGELIFNEGELGTEMYMIANGQVNIFLPGEGSRRISLKDLGPGEYFGELGLFDDKPRSASALATTDVALLGLSRPTLSTYLEHRPQAAMPMLRNMAERLRQTNALLSQRAAKNVVEELEKNLSWGDRLADKVATLNGSWMFIIGLGVLIVAWIMINVPGVLRAPFDAYPFVFFNLVLAILVVLQGPLIVMSQNRQSLKDRAQAETDFNVNLKNEVNIETIVRELGEFRAEALARLEVLESRSVPRAAANGN